MDYVQILSPSRVGNGARTSVIFYARAEIRMKKWKGVFKGK
jgi:hypothetical protein